MPTDSVDHQAHCHLGASGRTLGLLSLTAKSLSSEFSSRPPYILTRDQLNLPALLNAGLALSAAATYAPKNIRVNCVAPGLTRTPLAARITSSPAALKVGAWAARLGPGPGHESGGDRVSVWEGHWLHPCASLLPLPAHPLPRDPHALADKTAPRVMVRALCRRRRACTH